MNNQFFLVFLISFSFLTGCKSISSMNNCETVIYDLDHFSALPNFSGTLIRYEVVGVPDILYENSGPLIDIYIAAENEVIIVEHFVPDKSAIDELNMMQGQLLNGYPSRIIDLRDTRYID